MAETPKKRKKITIRELQRKMRAGEQIVQLEDIKKSEKLPQSIMPEGLLTGLSFNDVRDLIGYLQQ